MKKGIKPKLKKEEQKVAQDNWIKLAVSHQLKHPWLMPDSEFKVFPSLHSIEKACEYHFNCLFFALAQLLFTNICVLRSKFIDLPLIVYSVIVLSRHLLQKLYTNADFLFYHKPRFFEAFKCITMSIFAWTIYQILVSKTIVNFVCLVHPLAFQSVVFSQKEKQQTPQQELVHLIKVVLFESFEIVYVTFFLPIKFIKSTLANPSEEIYIEQFDVMVTGFFCLAILVIIKTAYNLQKRASEMQQHARQLGSWVKLLQPPDTVIEWKQGVNYTIGQVVSKQNETMDGLLSYYFAAGPQCNQSQPDDILANLLFQLFNEPSKTLDVLQSIGQTVLLLFLGYVLQCNVGTKMMPWLAFLAACGSSLLFKHVF